MVTVGLFNSSQGYKVQNENNPNRASETTQQNIFSKDQALKKVQEYKLQIDLNSPNVPKGNTLLEAYEIRGKIPAIKNLGWYSVEKGSETYIVSFKEQVNDLITEPQWEVTKDNIKALNGTALTYTPELEDKPIEIQSGDFEKQVYDTVSSLFKKYTDEVFSKYDDPSREQLDNAENRAIAETSTIYKITNDKVKEIFTKLDSIRY